MNHSIHTINQDFVDRRNERVVINIIPRDWVEMVEKRYCVERGLNRFGRGGKGGRGRSMRDMRGTQMEDREVGAR